ncbi:sel1 repeat family protein [Pseudoalteromonas xiamenensis]|uniref:Sel1 repeat family protein n=1 Tax=Pseudoalteromonas xiamenensis TaxID=882626 RepID=A0A975DIV4_9GAMM|nr:sel1 repeat family protein [Pseudoalteromonas xiamenensis]QTH71945.1 sel1 repeat family protein [Pseudoalteromonas xiamenensis]
MHNNPFESSNSADLEQQLNNVLSFVVTGQEPSANDAQFTEQTPLNKGLYFLQQKQFPQAAKWLRYAAMSGDNKAQFYMGLLFVKGQGVPQSVYHAVAWLSLAKSQGYDAAKPILHDLKTYITTRRFKEAECYAASLYEQIHQLHFFGMLKDNEEV